MAPFVPPLVLIAVVAIAVVGRLPATGGPASPSSAVPAGGIAAASSLPGAAASGSANVAGPSPTASLRSDWPGAIHPTSVATGPSREREEGTDGLMGGIVFGLPNDTPYPPAERIDRFTIDDVVLDSRAVAATTPRVRPAGGSGALSDHPYVR